MTADIGLIGLGTMGANLARNAARNGAVVAIYNRTASKTEEFMKQYGKEGQFVACKTLKEFCDALKKPRAVILMVKAGTAVDDMITELKPMLSQYDILIDAGNTLFVDTQRRCNDATANNLRFVGMGVSGGEEGALWGPSMMPGGDENAYKTLAPLLQKMAAKDDRGGRCIAYMGPNGAGHFVKMVHNGIEYGIMQLIAETYDILRSIGGYTNAELAETFHSWNELPALRSFLVDVTSKVFKTKDTLTSHDLVDVIKDAAGQKGTGKWTTEVAMTAGVAIPTINASVDARILSGSAELRRRGKKLQHIIDIHDPLPRPLKLKSLCMHALELSILCSYMQGFEMMQQVGKEQNWNLNLQEIGRIWTGGCIIRSGVLRVLGSAYGSSGNEQAAAWSQLAERLGGERQLDWRRVVQMGVSRGIGLPSMCASLSWYDSIVRERLPQNVIQAQRDFFGAHTYERTDREGVFHSHWSH